VLRVTAFGPRPEPVQELAVRLPKGLVTANRGEVTTPAADDRIQRQDEVRLAGRLVLSDDFSHPALMPVNRLRAGFDDSLETKPGRADGILAKVAPQEIKAHCSTVAGERMDHARFTRLQFQPHAFEFLREEGLALLYYLSVGVKNHQIIGVTDHRRSVPLAGKRAFDALLQPVQSNVGQQGGEGTALGSSLLSREPFPLVHDPSLQPRPDLASERRAGVQLLE
jgi:hypothetical protein